MCNDSLAGERILTGIPVSQWKAHINRSPGKDHHMNQGLHGSAPTKRKKKYLIGCLLSKNVIKLIFVYNLFKTCMRNIRFNSIQFIYIGLLTM